MIFKVGHDYWEKSKFQQKFTKYEIFGFCIKMNFLNKMPRNIIPILALNMNKKFGTQRTPRSVSEKICGPLNPLETSKTKNICQVSKILATFIYLLLYICHIYIAQLTKQGGSISVYVPFLAIFLQKSIFWSNKHPLDVQNISTGSLDVPLQDSRVWR